MAPDGRFILPGEFPMRWTFMIPAILCLLPHTACIPPIPDLHPALYLYPVKGPLAEQQPGLALTARTRGLASGTIAFQLPSGEACEGPWEPIPSGQAASELSAAWDLVFGPGYHTAQVLGARWRGRATLTGNRGTEVQLQFYRKEERNSPLLGVAKDSAGNVFKVTQ